MLAAAGVLLVSRIVLPAHGRAPRRATRAAGHRRRPPLDGPARRRPYPGPDDLDLQHHLRRRLVGARPLRRAAARPGRGRLRPAHHGPAPSAGWSGTALYGRITRRVSLGDLMRIGLIIETLTHLALAVTTSPWVAFGDLLRLRRARVHLGHDVDHHPPARGTHRTAGPGRQRQHHRRLRWTRGRLGDRRRRWPPVTASPRRSGSRSPARPCSWCCCGASSPASPTPTSSLTWSEGRVTRCAFC